VLRGCAVAVHCTVKRCSVCSVKLPRLPDCRDFRLRTTDVPVPVFGLTRLCSSTEICDYDTMPCLADGLPFCISCLCFCGKPSEAVCGLSMLCIVLIPGYILLTVVDLQSSTSRYNQRSHTHTHITPATSHIAHHPLHFFTRHVLLIAATATVDLLPMKKMSVGFSRTVRKLAMATPIAVMAACTHTIYNTYNLCKYNDVDEIIV